MPNQAKHEQKSLNSQEIDRLIAFGKDQDYSSRHKNGELAIFLTSEQNKNYSLNISQDEMITNQE